MAPLSPRLAFVRTAFAPPRDSAALEAAVDQVLGLGLGSGVGVGVGVGVGSPLTPGPYPNPLIPNP